MSETCTALVRADHYKQWEIRPPTIYIAVDFGAPRDTFMKLLRYSDGQIVQSLMNPALARAEGRHQTRSAAHPDPRGVSPMRAAYSAWKFKNEMRAFLARRYA